MSALVVLPEGALISLWDLARAIACALRPVIGAGASGMDCVTRKQVVSGLPIVDSHLDIRAGVSITDSDPEKSDSFSAAERWRAPFELAPEDCQALQQLLPKLPELRYPIDDGRRVEFLAAYRELAHGRYNWEPVLLTEGDVAEQQAEQDGVRRQYVDALRGAFDAGTLVVCDANHVPVKRIVFTTNCFVPRRSAIEYLERHGFEYQAPEVGAGQHDAESEKAQCGQSHAKWRPGERKLSPKQRRELFECHEELKGKIRAPVKTTAEKFGVSTKHVYKVVREIRNELEEKRIDQLLVSESPVVPTKFRSSSELDVRKPCQTRQDAG
ncbi:hypothetical protein [Burkholderia pseudomallei]